MIKVIFWPLIWVVLSLMPLLWLLFYLNWKNISHTFSIFLACCSKKIIFIFFFLLDRISILNIIKYSQWKWHFLVILKFQRGLYSHIVERIDTLLTAFESLMILWKPEELMRFGEGAVETKFEVLGENKSLIFSLQKLLRACSHRGYFDNNLCHRFQSSYFQLNQSHHCESSNNLRNSVFIENHRFIISDLSSYTTNGILRIAAINIIKGPEW